MAPVWWGGNVFIGFNSVLFNCEVGERCVIRHNSVVEGCHLPPGFHVPSTTNIHSDSELAVIPQVTANECDFSEDVTQTNLRLVAGSKKLYNEF